MDGQNCLKDAAMRPQILLLEPFYGGSHEELIDLILSEWRENCQCFTMTAKKWHWRARTAALHYAEVIPLNADYRTLFASSVLNLAELAALRPDLAQLRKILYFHENQLIYPVKKQQERDFQYGYNQILSCLVADHVVFNSNYNMESFLNDINAFLKLIPDYRPKCVSERIKPKCKVLYFPINFPLAGTQNRNTSMLHILWPHRWEHDKNPEMFFNVLFQLAEGGYRFEVSVLGESFEEKPEIFHEAEVRLSSQIVQWGYLESKNEYYKHLNSVHVVVSTSDHEFFGVAMIEATASGCLPLCPNKLVYPEIFPKSCLYATETQLFKRLKYFCKNPRFALQERDSMNFNFDQYSWTALKQQYEHLLLQ